MNQTILFGRMPYQEKPSLETMMQDLVQPKLDLGPPKEISTYQVPNNLPEDMEPEAGNYDEYTLATMWKKKDGTIYYIRKFQGEYKIYSTKDLSKTGSRVKTRSFRNGWFSHSNAQWHLNKWAKKAKMEPIGPKPQTVINHIWTNKKED